MFVQSSTESLLEYSNVRGEQMETQLHYGVVLLAPWSVQSYTGSAFLLLDWWRDPEIFAASDECCCAACVHRSGKQTACPAGIPVWGSIILAAAKPTCFGFFWNLCVPINLCPHWKVKVIYWRHVENFKYIYLNIIDKNFMRAEQKNRLLHTERANGFTHNKDIWWFNGEPEFLIIISISIIAIIFISIFIIIVIIIISSSNSSIIMPSSLRKKKGNNDPKSQRRPPEPVFLSECRCLHGFGWLCHRRGASGSCSDGGTHWGFSPTVGWPW